MIAMRSFFRHVLTSPSRTRCVGIIALAVALFSVVPASTYHCNYGMVEAGPLCSLCHAESPSATAGESTLDRGPCCTSEIVDASATIVPRDHSRGVPETAAFDGWLVPFLSPVPSPATALPRARQHDSSSLARAGTPRILRL